MKPETVIVELLGSHGRAAWRERIALDPETRSFSLGRSMAADVVLDDAYVAPLHARLTLSPDGVWMVSDLGSVNGLIVEGRRHRGVTELALPGAELQIGRSVLRVRGPLESLAPERADHADAVTPRATLLTAAVCGLGSAIFAAYQGWLEAPRDLASTAVLAVLWMLAMSGLWVGVWALLSRILTGEWRWMRHAAILFGVGLAFVLIGQVLDLAWFSLSLPRWDSRSTLIGVAGLMTGLYWHLLYASNMAQRSAAMVAVLLPLLTVGPALWLQMRAQQRNVNFIGAQERIYPPSLRMTGARDAAGFFDRVTALRQAADAKRAEIRDEDEGEDF
jgi:pSer/pThr/pTyr-binding forkhead associated (FHA) protein